MWELDFEESWAPKNWCFWTVVLEKTLEYPWDLKEIQPIHSKGDQSWVLFGRNEAKDETPVLWPLHVKSWLIGKYSDAGRDWGQEEKGPRSGPPSCNITIPTEVCLVKVMAFPIVIYGCEIWIIKNWALKNWYFWTVVLEKTLESPLDCMEIQPVCPKGNQSWIFIGRTDADAEPPVFWPPVVKNWLIGKDPDAGQDLWQVEKG